MASVSEGTEAAAAGLLTDLRAGKITIADLMGPLTGVTEVNSKGKIPAGGESFRPAVAPETAVAPNDVHNEAHVRAVHPPDWVNPNDTDEPYDLVVIGAGVAGLLSVIMGKALGKKCVLIEKHYMGGDCLNVGCFPSKVVCTFNAPVYIGSSSFLFVSEPVFPQVLIASAHRAHKCRHAAELGVVLPEGEVKVDFPKVMERMRKLREHIGTNIDSVARYKRDFCEEIFMGQAEFTGDHTIKVTGGKHGDRTLQFKKAMVGTGASPMVPPIPGLKDTPHLTNLNLFNLTELPETMLVIGAGPIGMELAQSFRRFGTKVFVFEMAAHFLPREDPDAAAAVQKSLERDGIRMFHAVKFVKVECSDDGNVHQAPFKKYTLTVIIDGEEQTFDGDSLLNGTGRAPNVHDIGLSSAGIKFDGKQGILVDEFYQTTNPDVYACGDVVSPFKFTHTADWSARLAIRNMFLGDKNREAQMVIPWCTFVDPEIAHVGLYEAELVASGIPHKTLMKPLEHIDRAIAEGTNMDGFVKMHLREGTDEIIGCTIVGPNAGDMISEVTTCIQYGIGATKLAGVMHPYPTTAEVVRQCAALHNVSFKTEVNKRALQMLMADVEADEKQAATRK